LQDLELQVITAPTLRIDLPPNRALLQRAVERLQPRLLILYPFVRLRRIDENASGEVAPLLAYLRELQRRYALAVLLERYLRDEYEFETFPVYCPTAPVADSPQAQRRGMGEIARAV